MSNWESARPWAEAFRDVFGAMLGLVFMFVILGMVQ